MYPWLPREGIGSLIAWEKIQKELRDIGLSNPNVFPFSLAVFRVFLYVDSIDSRLFSQRRAGSGELDLQRQRGKFNSQGRLALTCLKPWTLILKTVITGVRLPNPR